MDDVKSDVVVPVVEAPQVETKVRVKRVRGTLGRIKTLLEGKELSMEDVVRALESSGVSRNSIQSMLSQYVKKGVLDRTDVGYKLADKKVFGDLKPCI